MNGQFEHRSAVPWWAAFGAPLIGVPLLVGLLALGSATDGNGRTGVAADEEAGYATERTEALQASVGLPPVDVEGIADWRC